VTSAASASFEALCAAEEVRLFASISTSIEKSKDLEKGPGVYAIHYQDQCVYLGKAKCLRQRLSKHRRTIDDASRIEARDVTIQVLPSCFSLATGFEVFLIERHKPTWNASGFGSNAHGKGRSSQKQSCWNDLYGRVVTR
jgi:hypothetical protein